MRKTRHNNKGEHLSFYLSNLAMLIDSLIVVFTLGFYTSDFRTYFLFDFPILENTKGKDLEECATIKEVILFLINRYKENH